MAKMIAGNLLNINGFKVVLSLDEQINIDQLRKLSNGKQPQIEVIIDDGRSISVDQRKKIFAMLNDIAEWTGYSIRETEELMKYRYISQLEHPKWFSMADCSMTIATEFLAFIIDFCIKQDIPFKTKVIDEIVGDYRLVRECVLYRKCVLCSKHADIDHVKAIGMGRNRRTINQHGMYVLPLCRKHHQLSHSMGHLSFMQAYQLKPIKLDDEIIEKLNLTNKKEMERQDEK